MDRAVETLARSPKLPRLLDELQRLLREEAERRERFYRELREDQKAEFINGEVVVQSPAKVKHLNATKRLLKILDSYVEKHGLGTVFSEKALVCLSRNDYEPNIVFYGSAKASALHPDQMKLPAPDLVVEVLSASTEERGRGIKIEDYGDHGVGEYWIVDPEGEVVEQHVLHASRYQLESRKGDGELHSTVIKGLNVPVRAIFDPKENLKALQRILSERS
jgi:Uma2 family endonuclease